VSGEQVVLAFGVSAFLLETLISEDSLRAALCREERDPACFNSGDSSSIAVLN